MSKGLIAVQTIRINADSKKVWNALTDSFMVKQYLFGTEMIADWKVGGKIIYKGSWEGKQYEDKGTILKMEPEKVFQSTYWSSMAGKEASLKIMPL